MSIHTRHPLVLAFVGLLTGITLFAALTSADTVDTASAVPSGAKGRALVELGRRLFFDPVVSRTGQRACASCHDPEYGFSDPERVSSDDVGNTVRHSQTLIDSVFNPSAHWDGEFSSIEQLVTARIGLPQASSGGGYGNRTPTPITPGHSSVPTDDPEILAMAPDKLSRDLAALPRAQDVLETAGRYEALVKDAFGNAKLTRARVSQAIAAYCRTIQSTPAPYDHFIAGNARALSESEQRGLALFEGKAGCVQCHLLDVKQARRHLKKIVAQDRVELLRRGPATDYLFHNTGIAWLEQEANLESVRKTVTAAAKDPKQAKKQIKEEVERLGRRVGRIVDTGRQRISTKGEDLRAFKTPTLRDITRRGPYMHNGQFETLADVIRYYAGGGSEDPEQDKRLQPFEITEGEICDLVAFLGSLAGETRPGLADQALRQRASQTQLRFVDHEGKPLVGLRVALVPVGDVLPAEKAAGALPKSLVTDEKGRIEFAPGRTTHAHLRLPGALRPVGGPLVPDVCKKATVHLAVKGTVRFALTLPAGKPAPEMLRLEHQDTVVLPGHKAPRTLLVRSAVLAAGPRQIVTYEGFRRTDVPSRVRLQLPGTDQFNAYDLDEPGTLRANMARRIK
jgi:cytochrome c peroxidase